MKDTERKIIDATVLCLNMNEKASIDEIANHIGINRRTIHRHFKDRENLLQCCLQQMMAKCNHAMSDAYKSSVDPIKQVEAMFYAAFAIGNEYFFLKKLYNRSSYGQALKNESFDYESVKEKWFKLVAGLQDCGVIKNSIPISWIYNLFGGMIDIAIQAQATGDVSVNDIKSLAWKSFQGSIGIFQ